MLRDIAVVRNRKKLNGERLKKHRVALEYWDFEDNLGDFLAPVIVEWMLAQKGMNLQTICAGKKHLMAVGSILGLGRFDAVVWGSGVNSFENAAHVTEQKKYRKYDVPPVLSFQNGLSSHDVHHPRCIRRYCRADDSASEVSIHK